MPARAANHAATRCSRARQGVQTNITTQGTLRALVICGPTSSGKSEIALRAAQLLAGEIVNADSRQIYRGMIIGTGMPPQSAFDRVTHHLYGFLEPAQRYSAARFVEDAREVIREICSRGRMPIVVGGTGFYIEALLGSMPLDRPPADDALRRRLRREAGLHPPAVLWDWLAALRPALAAGIRPNDSYRILRGLESAMAQPAGRSRSLAPPPPIAFAVALLRVPRNVLRLRIARRVREMFAQGLVPEAQAVRAAVADAPALSGLGYAEALALHDGLATPQEALALATRRTEQYAKRQETWFRRMPDVSAIDAQDQEAAVVAIVALAREKLSPT